MATAPASFRAAKSVKRSPDKEKDKDDRRRELRRLQDEVPDDSYTKYLTARQVIEAHEGSDKAVAAHNITAMQSGQHGEFYQVDLGNGYTMVVDKLLATSRWNFDW